MPDDLVTEDILDGADDAQPAGAPKDIIDDSADDEVKGTEKPEDLLSDDEAPDEGSVVPEDGKYAFEAPDGVAVDQERLDEFMGTAKDLGITQGQFSKLVEYDIARQQASATEAVGAWNKRVEDWRAAAQADPALTGADGGFNGSIKIAKAALTKYGDDELTSLMRSPSADNPGGLAVANHPAMLRFLTKVGAALAEPTLVTDDADAPSTASAREALDSMYPTMKSS